MKSEAVSPNNKMPAHSITEPSPNGKTVEVIKIPVPWGHVSGKWWGSRDAVPLLALHGYNDSSGSFDRLAPLLDVPALLALDLPGHGKSSHLPRGACYQLVDFVLGLRFVVKHFRWRKVSIFGHSFGSLVGLVYTACYPEEVHSFISLECGRFSLALRLEPGPSLIRHHMEQTMIHAETQLNTAPAYNWEDLVDEYQKATSNSVDRQHVGLILSGNVSPHPTAKGFVCLSRDRRFRPNRSILGFPDFNLLPEFVRKVTCHVMEIFSSRGLNSFQMFQGSDILAKRQREHEMLFRESAASYERRELEGTHHVHLNHPERVAPVVNNFIRRTTEGQQLQERLLSRM